MVIFELLMIPLISLEYGFLKKTFSLEPDFIFFVERIVKNRICGINTNYL